MNFRLLVLGAFICLLAGGCASTPPPDLFAARAAAGRALADRYANAIVKIDLVSTMKLSIGGRSMPPRERKIEANGTVISPTGLTVTALTVIDPNAAFEQMRASLSEAAARVELEQADYKEVKLGLSDGTQIPAKVVLKDPDLDLAFIMPDAGDSAAHRPFAYVKLEDAAKGEILGNYYILWRTGKAFQWVPLINFSTVTGIIEKPRRMFVVSEQSLGSPVFDSGGNVLGICVRRSGGNLATIVVLPAADVANEARQAAAAKPEETAAPASKDKPAPPAESGDNL